METRWRLMDAESVRIATGPFHTELRGNCVDIAAFQHQCVITVVRLEYQDLNAEPEHFALSGRVVIPAPYHVIDAMEGDGFSWRVVSAAGSGNVDIRISPRKGEHIWLDNRPGAAPELAYLYRRQFMCRMWLRVYERLLSECAESSPLYYINTANVAAFQKELRVIEGTIAEKNP